MRVERRDMYAWYTRKKGFIFLFFITILLIGIVFFYFNSQVKEQKLDSVLDQCTIALEKKLKSEKMSALEMALTLSKNQHLIDALENMDEERGYAILSDIMKTIQKHTGRYIRAQILTSEYTIFARSWDDVYAGMPLEDYRQDLYYFQTHATPRTSIEVGRRLGIKATVPLFKEGRFLGFFEVIDFFESVTDYFRALGIDLYVLLDYQYYDRAILMQGNLVLHNHIIANINYNFSNLQTLKKIDFKELQANRIVQREGKYIFYETMYDGEGEAIGGFVFVLAKDYLEYFRDPEDDISFLINVTRSNLYDVVKQRDAKDFSLDQHSAETMLYLRDIVSREDRELFYEEAYKKLSTHSKDELIQMMLGDKVVKKIDGKIR